MNILKLLYKLRFNSKGEIDTKKAIFDGSGYHTVDDFIRMTDGDSYDHGDVVMQGYEIIDAETGEVLYKVLSGDWDSKGKFWPY